MMSMRKSRRRSVLGALVAALGLAEGVKAQGLFDKPITHTWPAATSMRCAATC